MDTNKISLATMVEHELCDGTKVNCTIAMFRLKQLANVDRTLYDVVMNTLSKGTKDIFESVRFVYAAYVCANMGADNLITEDDFLIMCGSDYVGLNQTIEKLTNPKKHKVSGGRSN